MTTESDAPRELTYQEKKQIEYRRTLSETFRPSRRVPGQTYRQYVGLRTWWTRQGFHLEEAEELAARGIRVGTKQKGLKQMAVALVNRRQNLIRRLTGLGQSSGQIWNYIHVWEASDLITIMDIISPDPWADLTIDDSITDPWDEGELVQKSGELRDIVAIDTQAWDQYDEWKDKVKWPAATPHQRAEDEFRPDREEADDIAGWVKRHVEGATPEQLEVSEEIYIDAKLNQWEREGEFLDQGIQTRMTLYPYELTTREIYVRFFRDWEYMEDLEDFGVRGEGDPLYDRTWFEKGEMRLAHEAHTLEELREMEAQRSREFLSWFLTQRPGRYDDTWMKMQERRTQRRRQRRARRRMRKELDSEWEEFSGEHN